MRLFRLNKEVLSIRSNAGAFINGLSSNTLDKPRNAFLNQHGRIIATFEQIQVADDEFLIVIAPFSREALLNHLARYARLSKTVIENTDYAVYFDLDSNFPLEGDWKIPQHKGQMIVTRRPLPSEVSEEEFTLFRLDNNISLFGVDYLSDILILNVDEHEYVSYTKGCFLGQEPVAKVHNRSKPSWKLVVANVPDVLPEERARMTSVVKDRGFVFIANK